MPHPDDNTLVNTAVDEIREHERRPLEQQIAELTDQLADVGRERDEAVNEAQALQAQLTATQTALEECRASHEEPEPAGLKIIGMSSPADLWATRLAQVGRQGIRARRIFADFRDGALDQMNLVGQAVEADMMPVVSYKVANVPAAIRGDDDQNAGAAATALALLGVPVRVAVWHEPHGDMDPEQFVALNERLLPFFKRGQVKVGCFLNGWLLDRQQASFDSYTSDRLFELWDWFGIDTYEAGTMAAPGDVKPADRIPKLVAYLASKGHSDLPVGIGEYNGYSAATIRAAGEAMLSCRQLEFACMWNSTAGKGHVLTGDRLTAFQETKADSRVRQ